MVNKKYKFNKQILNESLKVDEIFVYLDEKDESDILQNELFKLGFLWCDGSNDVYQPIVYGQSLYEMIICISIKNKDLSYISSIEEFKEYNSNDVRLYSFSDLEQIIDIITSKPNYKSKQKPSRILEKYFHENYKYTTIPFKIETDSDLNKIKLFLNNNKDLFINLNSNIDETFTHITNIYLYKHIDIIIQFMIDKDNKLIFLWDQYDDFVYYVDKKSYEKIYNIDDLQHNIINNIIKYGNPYPHPEYKPKNKNNRVIENMKYENIKPLHNYNYVGILAKSIDENINIQKILFENGCKWNLPNDNGQTIQNINDDNIIIVVYNNGDVINVDNSYMYTVQPSSFEQNITPFNICPYLFKFNEINIYIDYLKKGIIQPSYLPKQKPIRESILSYDKIFIYVKNDDENKIIQETLFKKGFKWNSYGNHFHPLKTPVLLSVYFNRKHIKYTDELMLINNIENGTYPNAYPKLYDFNNLGEFINLLTTNGMIPDYEPKSKPNRGIITLKESIKISYKKIIITINDVNESDIFFKYLKKIPQLVNILNHIDVLLKHASSSNEFPIFISIFKIPSNIFIFEWDNISELDEYCKENIYDKIFTIKDIKNDFITNILNYGTYKPNYNKKLRISKENKINEEVADNIHLDDDLVLNHYDNDAYAFLFYNGYPNGKFIIEQGSTHKNMLSNYLYKIKDKNYMEVYHSPKNNDYLYDRLDDSEYKGRLWLNSKVISFWDLSYNEQDSRSLKNILKTIENKLNIKISNDWLIEFFDIEKQRLYLITLDKYFKGELDESDSEKMSNDYFDHLKQQHLNTNKKNVIYGFGSKNPKYKPLPYRQALYQESLNNTINIKNMTDELKNYINKYIKPSYKPKNKIDRMFESNKWYPYRFKTKEEFIKKFGNFWKDLIEYGWNTDMNHLFGELYPFDITEETQRLNRFEGWSISWDMLTKNKPITPSYEPKNKIVRENLITEDCDFVILPNGKKLKYTDFDAIPFMYIDNKLLIGNNGSIHYNMIYDYILSINGKTDDSYELYNNSLKGRLWLNSKVISFWEYIKKDNLVKVISDIKQKLNINIDNTWLLDYYENEEFDDKLGKNLIPINDYLTGDYKDNTNDVEYQRMIKRHIDKTFKYDVPFGFGSKNPKNKLLKYKQLLYQEKKLPFNKK